MQPEAHVRKMDVPAKVHTSDESRSIILTQNQEPWTKLREGALPGVRAEKGRQLTDHHRKLRGGEQFAERQEYRVRIKYTAPWLMKRLRLSQECSIMTIMMVYFLKYFD